MDIASTAFLCLMRCRGPILKTLDNGLGILYPMIRWVSGNLTATPRPQTRPTLPERLLQKCHE